jgi:putative pyruvate formate lyase activating enzyme
MCPRSCNVDRSVKCGFCGSNNKVKIGKIMLHKWEEPILAKENSGAIFFSNCPLKCVFCQNYEISQQGKGKYFSVEELVEVFKDLEGRGAENIDLVSPTQYSQQIIEALKIYKPKVPVVWNSNGYESVETLEKLKGLVDIFLPDIKYASDKLALEYSKCADYFEYATKAILKMREICPEDIYEGDKLIRGMIVRHLVLPGNYLNTKLVLKWIKDYLGDNTIISIMSQYVPYYMSINHNLLSRSINVWEYEKVEKLVFDLGFKNGFLQELSSADECYIPDFEQEFE